MKMIQVTTPSKHYPVIIAEDALTSLLTFLVKECQHTKLMVLTDSHVADLYLADFVNQLTSHGFSVNTHIVAPGEASKSMEAYYRCITACLEVHLSRTDMIIAFGGGVVGDLAGFVAATYMRGIRFIQVPTTLLAHDSAVGGKVAINHERGKNLIGAFYQPEAVFYHLPFLATLSDREWRSGFAEVIKEAMIADDPFYSFLTNQVTCIDRIRQHAQTCIERGITIKSAIVSEDEKEVKQRAMLNFGHTFGHAIETTHAITHGEAVAIGMLFAIELSTQMSGLSFDISKFEQWLRSLGYLQLECTATSVTLIEKMRNDKKNQQENITFVLLKELGNPCLVEIPPQVLNEKIADFIRRFAVTSS